MFEDVIFYLPRFVCTRMFFVSLVFLCENVFLFFHVGFVYQNVCFLLAWFVSISILVFVSLVSCLWMFVFCHFGLCV